MQELYLTTTSEKFEAIDPVKEKATEAHDRWTSELMPCLMELASKTGQAQEVQMCREKSENGKGSVLYVMVAFHEYACNYKVRDAITYYII